MEFWYVEVWCNCSNGELRAETYAPFSTEELALEKRDACLKSPFFPQDLDNYVVGCDQGEILPDGRIICGQHVFPSLDLDSPSSKIECRWKV